MHEKRDEKRYGESEDEEELNAEVGCLDVFITE